MEKLTASEIAGYGVGALLLCATIVALEIVAFSSQRRCFLISAPKQTGIGDYVSYNRRCQLCTKLHILGLGTAFLCYGDYPDFASSSSMTLDAIKTPFLTLDAIKTTNRSMLDLENDVKARLEKTVILPERN